MKIARSTLFLIGLMALCYWASMYLSSLRILPWNPINANVSVFIPPIISIVAALFAYRTAAKLHRRAGQWAAFSFFMPFLAPFILAFLPDLVPASSTRSFSDSRPEKKKGSTSLYGAIRAGKPHEALLLIDEGADVRQARAGGDTPLHAASFMGYADIAAKLIEKGAIVDARISGGGDPGATPLFIASMRGHSEIVSLLIENGANVNARLAGDKTTSTSGASPLHLAATNGKIEAMRILAERGADIDAEDDYGDTALHYAVNKGQKETVRGLLSMGARVDAVDDYGRTPMSLADGDDSMMGILKEAEAHPVHRDRPIVKEASRREGKREKKEEKEMSKDDLKLAIAKEFFIRITDAISATQNAVRDGSSTGLGREVTVKTRGFRLEPGDMAKMRDAAGMALNQAADSVAAEKGQAKDRIIGQIWPGTDPIGFTVTLTPPNSFGWSMDIDD